MNKLPYVYFLLTVMSIVSTHILSSLLLHEDSHLLKSSNESALGNAASP